MSTRPIAITGLGMASSLGMDVANACAAARAGISRASELKVMNFSGGGHFGQETVDGFPPFAGHPCAIAAGFTGRAKLTLLGSAALTDLMNRSKLSPSELKTCKFFLNVSDRFIEQAEATRLESGEIAESFSYPPEEWRNEASQTLDSILKRSRVEIPYESRVVTFGGHAGFVEALAAACAALRSNFCDRAIVGAVDSCLEPHFLESAAVVRVLKTGDNPVGFTPGEGSAFVLLERPAIGRSDRHPLAKILAEAVDKDPSHQFTEKPASGSGLAAAIRNVLSTATSGAPPDFLITDLNGLERRAVDWGYALVRLERKAAVSALPVWLPAASFGETGAAAGAVAVCVAVRAFERNYAPGHRALLTLASDSSARGALFLEAS